MSTENLIALIIIAVIVAAIAISRKKDNDKPSSVSLNVDESNIIQPGGSTATDNTAK